MACYEYHNFFRKFWISFIVYATIFIGGFAGYGVFADDGGEGSKVGESALSAKKAVREMPEGFSDSSGKENIAPKGESSYRSRVIKAMLAGDEIELQKIEKEAERLIPPSVLEEIKAKGAEIRRRWDKINEDLILLTEEDHLFIVKSHQVDNVYGRQYDPERDYDATRSERANHIRKEMHEVTQEERKLFSRILSYLEK